MDNPVSALWYAKGKLGPKLSLNDALPGARTSTPHNKSRSRSSISAISASIVSRSDAPVATISRTRRSPCSRATSICGTPPLQALLIGRDNARTLPICNAQSRRLQRRCDPIHRQQYCTKDGPGASFVQKDRGRTRALCTQHLSTRETVGGKSRRIGTGPAKVFRQTVIRQRTGCADAPAPGDRAALCRHIRCGTVRAAAIRAPPDRRIPRSRRARARTSR